MPHELHGRVLVIAGSDSGGGAGIQGDIKAIAALGGYAATAITALTAQNTLGVQGVLPISPEFVEMQMRSVLSDIGADAFKTGMLHDSPVIRAVARVLNDYPDAPLVVDPVMVAKGGAPLLDPDAVRTLTRDLLPRALIITPNVPEAEVLTGIPITRPADMRHAAQMLLTLGAPYILLKGGHLEGETVTDLLASSHGIDTFEHPRIDSRHTHGTGCALASAIAAGLAQGMPLREAVIRARAFVHEAIHAAPGFGGGHGPLNHSVSF